MADIFDMADTWNNGATTFTAIKMNVTDTASAAASMLADLQVGGASMFSVRKDGLTYVGGRLQFAGTTSAFPSLKRIATGLAVRLADDSDYGPLTSSYFTAASNLFIGLAADVALGRGGADILELARSANAQTFNWYRSKTDASNYERGSLKTQAGIVELAAETAGTGTDDLDVLLTPAGAGKVRFGTHSALAAESVTGYITMKDAGGTTRKVAVMS